MTAEFEAELLRELEPGGEQLTQLMHELYREVLDNGSEELEMQLVSLARRASEKCWTESGPASKNWMWYAGQLQGMAGVLMTKRRLARRWYE